jgi:hypothetical protein
MDVGPDPQRAIRKLSQIGYYRLSGFGTHAAKLKSILKEKLFSIHTLVSPGALMLSRRAQASRGF